MASIVKSEHYALTKLHYAFFKRQRSSDSLCTLHTCSSSCCCKALWELLLIPCILFWFGWREKSHTARVYIVYIIAHNFKALFKSAMSSTCANRTKLLLLLEVLGKSPWPPGEKITGYKAEQSQLCYTLISEKHT